MNPQPQNLRAPKHCPRPWRFGLACMLLLTLLTSCTPPAPTISRWSPPTDATAPAALRAVIRPTVSPVQAERRARTITDVAGDSALEAYTATSTLNDTMADGALRFFTRSLPDGGRLDYVVAILTEALHVEVLTANGATLGSDATGDTIWVDGQHHLQTVQDMANAEPAVRPDRDLAVAMAFGFHGAERTADEGSVVVNGVAQRINPWRSTLCIGPDRSATLNFFDERTITQCEQAAGAGPVIVWRKKIANPDVSAETEEFLPYNPLGEDFVELGYRIETYRSTRPKTAIGTGILADGRFYLVLMNALDTNGLTVAQALRDLGCIDASGGDDGSSTQMVWRGAPVAGRVGREVPTAVAIYVRR